MNNEFQEILKQKTEPKAPPPGLLTQDTSSYNNNSFLVNNVNDSVADGPRPEAAEPINKDFDTPPPGILTETKEKEPVDVDFVTDTAIMSIDVSQQLIFVNLHKKKLKKQLFANTDQFKKAKKLCFSSTNTSIDEEIILIEKYKQYESKISEIANQLEFTETEEKLLQQPLAKMVEVNNLDLPPWLALTIAAANIFGTRIIDLKFD